MPTSTFNIADIADDGHLYVTGASYPPNTPGYDPWSTTIYVARNLDSNWVGEGLLRWDTSSIPDNATITSAKVRIRNLNVSNNADSRLLQADYYPWVGSTADYTLNPGNDAVSGMALANFATAGVDVDIPLENVATGINKGGYTSLRFAISGGVATGYNDVTWASIDHVTAPEPQLIVDYTPGPQQTFSIAQGTDDGIVYKTAASYPPSGTNTFSFGVGNLWVERFFSGGNYRNTLTLLRFDTSSLPDNATVVGATLRIMNFTTDNPDGRSLTADYYPWDGVSDSDWTITAGTSAHAGTPLSSITANPTVGSQNDFALQNLSNISKTGITSLRLHISGGQPTAYNAIQFADYESAITEPQLIVDYTVSAYDETMRPTSVSGLTNLTGAVTDIDQDPNDATITDAGLVGSDPAGNISNQYATGNAAVTGWTAMTSTTNAQGSTESTYATVSPGSVGATGGAAFTYNTLFATIPASAVISSITVEADEKVANAGRGNYTAQLANGATTYLSAKTISASNTTDAVQTYTWTTADGTLPTVAQIQATGFGVRKGYTRTANATTYSLDWVRMTVEYTLTTNTQADVALGDPAGTLATGADSGQIQALMRKRGTGSNPQGRIEISNAARTWTQAVIADQTLTTSDWTLYSGTFDQSVITSKTDVVARFVGTGAAGGLAELGPIEWNARTTTATLSSEIVTTPVTLLLY